MSKQYWQAFAFGDREAPFAFVRHVERNADGTDRVEVYGAITTPHTGVRHLTEEEAALFTADSEATGIALDGTNAQGVELAREIEL